MVDESKIKVGQWAISLGVGYGDTSPAMSTGIISAKNRIGGRAIQTDANISPANYGGPLVDIEGTRAGHLRSHESSIPGCWGGSGMV